MKRLTCEMCGSTDLIKQDGVFVCQSCGIKYSVEEARKMMIEGTVEITGTVKVDNSERIAGYLKMAYSAIESSNYKEAELYANRIIENDSSNAEAWMIKGKAAGWQSTLGNLRFNESIECWNTALINADHSLRIRLEEDIPIELLSLAKALTAACARNFADYPTKESGLALVSSFNNSITSVISLTKKTGLPVDLEELEDYVSSQMNKAAVAASKKADAAFGPDNSRKNKFAWEHWLEQIDSCIAVLESALTIASRIDTVKRIVSNLEALQSNCINSCSYRFQASAYTSSYVVDYKLSDSAKQYRKNQISVYKQKMDSKILEIKRGTEAKKRAEESARKSRIEAYWAEHFSEKQELETELVQLAEKKATYLDDIEALQRQFDEVTFEDTNVPAAKEKAIILGKIAELENELAHLGIFKSKEKKELQERITEFKESLTDIDKQVEKEKLIVEAKNEEAARTIDGLKEKIKPIQAKVDMIDAKILAVQHELEKER